ncbi:hypothetical protein GCM10027047_16850 [Rhodococcus aerolatus]
MSNRITDAKARAELALTEAQSRLITLSEEPELGGARNTDEGFHIGIGAAAAGAIGIAVAAFVAKKMGALG